MADAGSSVMCLAHEHIGWIMKIRSVVGSLSIAIAVVAFGTSPVYGTLKVGGVDKKPLCILDGNAPGCNDTDTTTIDKTKRGGKDRTNDIDYIRIHDPYQYAQIIAREDDCKNMREGHQQNTARYKQFCAAAPPLQVTEYIVREQFETVPLPK